MRQAGRLTIVQQGDRELVMTRAFNAPRSLVYRTLVEPDLVRRWLLGPSGWTMPVCEIDARVGGKYRYEWQHADGRRMGMGGVFLEVVPPERLVQTELFDEAWYPGEAIDTTILTELSGVTTLRLSVLYQSAEALHAAAKSGMDQGMAVGYDRLEALLASLP